MPTTDAGKAVSAQNALTHGLTARQVVLPAHGEDPAEYEALRREIIETLQPRNALERQHVETIAAATWRLSRFRRWQTSLYEDGDLTEDERLAKIERALRHETALHRQITRAMHALTQTLPDLLAARRPPEIPAATCIESKKDTPAVSQDKPAQQNCKNELPPNAPVSRIRASDLWDVQTILPSRSPRPLGSDLAQQARRLALATGHHKK